jgi:hypothetical protein
MVEAPGLLFTRNNDISVTLGIRSNLKTLFVINIIQKTAFQHFQEKDKTVIVTVMIYLSFNSSDICNTG